MQDGTTERVDQAAKQPAVVVSEAQIRLEPSAELPGYRQRQRVGQDALASLFFLPSLADSHYCLMAQAQLWIK